MGYGHLLQRVVLGASLLLSPLLFATAEAVSLGTDPAAPDSAGHRRRCPRPRLLFSVLRQLVSPGTGPITFIRRFTSSSEITRSVSGTAPA
jgi:hypothetical protein